MKKISFNSIVSAKKNMSAHFLAFIQLKSYMVHKGADRHFSTTFNLFENDAEDRVIADQILEQDSDIIAFSAYPWNVRNIKRVCGLLKEAPKRTFIVLGGPYATYTAESWIREGNIDLIVKGEGEEVFCRLLDNILRNDYDFSAIANLVYRENGTLRKTHADHSFDPGMQVYPLQVENGNSDVFLYETSRGCPFQCRYCSWDLSQHRKIRFYPKEKVEKDLRAIFALPNIRRLIFCDSDLFVNRTHGLWLLRFVHELNAIRVEKGLHEIGIYFGSNPEYINDEIIEELQKLPLRGNQVAFGLQTLDEHVNRQFLNRPFHKEKYLRNLKHVLDRLKNTNTVVSVDLIYGLPGDTYEGFRKTLDSLFSEIPIEHIMHFPLMVLPGSYFWDHAAEYGLVFEQESPHTLISSGTFSLEDMKKVRRLVFFMQMFENFFQGIRRFVEKKIPSHRISVYEDIIDHISINHPDFVSEIYGIFEEYGEASMMLFQVDAEKRKKYLEIRYEIIRGARDIVKRHMQQRLNREACA